MTEDRVVYGGVGHSTAAPVPCEKCGADVSRCSVRVNGRRLCSACGAEALIDGSIVRNNSVVFTDGVRMEIVGDEQPVSPETRPALLNVQFADALDGVVRVANEAEDSLLEDAYVAAEDDVGDWRYGLISKYVRERHQEIEVLVATLTSVFDQMWLAPSWPAGYLEYRRRALAHQAELFQAADDMQRRRRGNADHPDVHRAKLEAEVFSVIDDAREWEQARAELANLMKHRPDASRARIRELEMMGLDGESWGQATEPPALIGVEIPPMDVEWEGTDDYKDCNG